MTRAHTPERIQSVVRLTELDGLRGLAACAVAAYHAQILFMGGLGDFYGGAVGWFFHWGWTFVDLFFVISGYIFAHVYLGGAGLGDRRRLEDFAVARVARLYPLHLTMLCVVAVLDWGKAENMLPTFLAHLFMLQGVVPGADEGFDGPSWSISVEVICYALFALAARSGGRTLTAMSAGLVVAIAVKLAALGLPGGPWGADYFVRGIMGFFAGQLLWRYRTAAERVPTAVLVLALAAGVTIDTGAYSPLLPLGLLAWPAALLLALRVRTLASAPFVWLGDRSYAVYLIHYPVLNLFYRALGKSYAATPTVLACYASFAAVVLLLSNAAYRRIERPGRSAVREAWQRFRLTQRPRAAAVTAD